MYISICPIDFYASLIFCCNNFGQSSQTKTYRRADHAPTKLFTLLLWQEDVSTLSVFYTMIGKGVKKKKELPRENSRRQAVQTVVTCK